MKKIGTLTTHSALNYGAVLQAYALSTYINKYQDVDCEIIDYQPQYVEKSYKLIKKPSCVKDIALVFFQLLHYQERKKRKNKFLDFKEENLHLSHITVKNRDDIIPLANSYDLIFCGSDQIWSPRLHNFDEAYFLSFPEIKTVKVSYAASFGQDYISEKDKEELRHRLKSFAKFGCREYTAQNIILKLTDKTPQMVLDPVFLLNAEEWRKLESPVSTNEKYILAYFLSNPGKTLSQIEKKAKVDNIHAYSIGFSPRDYKYKVITKYDLGPAEFLAAIDNADIVITNSFHATAFSIIFRKKFFVRIGEGTETRNDRIISLLKMIGLEDRIFTDKNADKVDFSSPIDYSKIEKNMSKWISVSKDYIKEVLDTLL